jgi:hypothetical protein
MSSYKYILLKQTLLKVLQTFFKWLQTLDNMSVCATIHNKKNDHRIVIAN